jgi:hypothetical protein
MEYEHPGLIRYRLEKEGDLEVLFQVLWQNEGTRNLKGIGAPQLKWEGLMNVGSSLAPEITSSTIWLRGAKPNDDDRVSVRTLGTFTAREQYYIKVVNAIAAWSEMERWAPLLENLYPRQEQLSLWD